MRVDAILARPSPRVAGRVLCTACEHWCSLPPGRTGKCGVRRNVDGRLQLLVYGKAASAAVDPVEKKPLFHFLPGGPILSLGTYGCNLRCTFCQNWEISQRRERVEEGGLDLSPETIVERCLALDIPMVAFTYNEPTVFFEYAYDTARLARRRGIRTAFVSSGFETTEALNTMAPYLDAINVDLKAFRDETYRRVIGGRLRPVLRNIEHLAASDVWVEVTTLIVPGMNDSDEELREAAAFLAGVSPDLPWHVTAFHPDHLMRDRPPTPVPTLLRAREIGLEAGLRYVYLGNVSGPELQSTACPDCGRVLVARNWYAVEQRWERPGQCPCGTRIPGVWDSGPNRAGR